MKIQLLVCCTVLLAIGCDGVAGTTESEREVDDAVSEFSHLRASDR